MDTELGMANQCATLARAKVLDTVFMTKKQVVRLEPELLRHVVKRWISKTYTFICAWGEFTPTLKYVANIMHLLIAGLWISSAIFFILHTLILLIF